MTRIRSKRNSWLMKFISFFLGRKFLTHFWTTLTPWTIWAPIDEDVDNLGPETKAIVEHEMVHVRQIKRWWLLFHLSYLLLPLPFGLAYFRWVWEREAYLVNIRAGTHTVDDVVRILWNYYGWCWPRPWMRKWLEANR